MAGNEIFRGCMPALMTPCGPGGEPDYDALVATGKSLLGKGMSAVIYCGSMGEWPLLTDEQRQTGVQKLTEAGVPVIVGTGAQNPRIARDHAAHAQKVGAAGLMVIPRVLSRGTAPAAQYDHFTGILQAAPGLPAVIYNSPYYGFADQGGPVLPAEEREPQPGWLQGIRRRRIAVATPRNTSRRVTHRCR